MFSVLMKKALVGGVSSLLMATWPLSCFNKSDSTVLIIRMQDWEVRDGIVIRAPGRPNQPMAGFVQSDLANPVGTVTAFGPTKTDDDGDVRVADGRLNANWYVSMTWYPGCVDNVNYTPPRVFTQVTDYVNIYDTGMSFGSHTYVCEQLDIDEPDAIDSGFSTDTSHPGTITVKSNQVMLTSTYGMPLLRLYGNGTVQR